MKIINNYLTTSPCYLAGKTIAPKGLMIHSVGVPQPNATVFVNTWKTSNHVCAHAVMGRDGNVYQVLPWNRRGWHAGNPANDMFISIELTEPNTIKYTSGANFTDNNPTATKAHVSEVYAQAVLFASYICKLYKFDPLNSNQLLSHSEGYKKGFATNHGDVEHMWSKYGLSMGQFRTAVSHAMGGTTTPPVTGDNLYRVRKTWADSASQKGAFSILASAKTCADQNPGYSVFDGKGAKIYGPGGGAAHYLVKINTDVLTTRTGPGTNHGTNGSVLKNQVYTIIEQNNDWGKLKSGAGWISLTYTVRV